MFRKRIQDLTADDIQRVVAEQWAESQEFELKEALPGHDIRTTGKQLLGEKAKRDLLDEIVAFANTHGGILIIGIAETDENPKRARSIEPIHNCADLAESLGLVCVDQIEPRMPPFEIRGIETAENGAGVIVVQVPASRVAPHRNKISKECTRRSRDRCEKMTMRDIQDLTLQAANRGQRVEERFAAAKASADQWFKDFYPKTGMPAQRAMCASLFRATFLVDDLALGRLHERGAELLVPRELSVDRRDPIDLYVQRVDWRPVVRGTRAHLRVARGNALMTLSNDGAVELCFSHVPVDEPEGVPTLYMDNVVGLFVTAIDVCERLRSLAASDAEYAIDTQFIADGDVRLWIGRDHYDERLHGPTASKPSITLPRYSFGPISEASALVGEFQRDLWDGLGLQEHERFNIRNFEFPRPRAGHR